MSSSNAKEALEILGYVAERTKVEPGCISCRIYRDAQQQQTIMFEELWNSTEDLQRHLCSSDYQRVLLVIELAKGQPEVRFSTISSASGFESIAEARSDAQRAGNEAVSPI